MLELTIKTGRSFFLANDFVKAEELFQNADKLIETRLNEDKGAQLAQHKSTLLAYRAHLLWVESQSPVALHMINRALSSELLKSLTAFEVSDKRYQRNGLMTNVSKI
jgi:hypothetical protein